MEKEKFEKLIINSFNEAIKQEKSCYSETMDIKRSVFIFSFKERSEIVVKRFVKSLISWIIHNDLSVDKLLKSDIVVTERNIKLLPARGLRLKEIERLKAEKAELKTGV